MVRVTEIQTDWLRRTILLVTFVPVCLVAIPISTLIHAAFNIYELATEAPDVFRRAWIGPKYTTDGKLRRPTP